MTRAVLRRFGVVATLLFLGMCGSIVRVPIASAATDAVLANLSDNTWQQLTLASSSRYLTPAFVVTSTPVTDPNPRTRAYSGLIAGNNRIFYFGGGHRSYAGNDVEVFDPRSLRWDQLTKPEACPFDPAVSCYTLYSYGTNEVTPLGHPYTEHSYQVYAYDPVQNRLLLILNSGTWAFDLTSRTWAALAGPAAGNTFSPRGIGPGNRHLLSYDLDLRAFQAIVTAGPTTGVYVLDDTRHTWSKRGMPPETAWGTLYSTYAADRHVHFVYGVSWTHKWWAYDGKADRWTPLPAPPLVPDSFDYDTRNRVVVAAAHPNASTFRVMVYDPDAARWTEMPRPSRVPPMSGGISATPMAWRYVPSENVFILLAGERGANAGGATTTWAYRYKGGAGSPSPADTLPPTVSLASSTTGSTVSGVLTLKAAAADNVAVVGIQFLLDGNPLGPEQTSPPFTFAWNTAAASNGTHTLTAVARDAAGNLSMSAPVTVTVANGTPTTPPSSTPPPATGGGSGLTFAQRCAKPGVVRCYDFSSAESIKPYLYPAHDNVTWPTYDPTMRASGTGSLKMTVPAKSAANSSGAFAIDFTPNSLPGSRTDPYPAQFGEGSEFYVQWRQRFSPEFLTTKWAGGGGWKQIDIGEGDRTGVAVGSCTQLEMVVNNYLYKGFPRMYHSCGAKDGQYQGLYETVLLPGRTTPEIKIQNLIDGCTYQNQTVPPCVGYKPNQWMTFQIHVKVGTWYRNDKNYHRDSTVELWVAEENKSSVQVLKITGYDIANQNPAAKYGKLWLMPYNTGKDPNVAYPVAYTWYADLIISRTKIDDPTPGPTPAPAPSGSPGTGSIPAPSPAPGTGASRPSAPTGFTGTAVSGYDVRLQWKAPADPRVAGYRVYRNGIPLTRTTTAIFEDKTVAAGRTYSYAVASVDQAGVQSVTVSTLVSTPARATTTPSSTPGGVVNMSAAASQVVAAVKASALWRTTTTVAPADTVEAFVARAYRTILARDANASELSSWSANLRSGASLDSVRGMVDRLYRSPEYLDRRLTLADRASSLYVGLLGREPSSGETSTWEQMLVEWLEPMLPAVTLLPEFARRWNGLADSTSTSGFVDHLYRAALGRPATQAEIDWWSEQLLKSQDVRALADAVFESDEYLAVPRTLDGHIRTVYQALLGRSPAPMEVTTWMPYLIGQVQAVDDRFMSGPEFAAYWRATLR